MANSVDPDEMAISSGSTLFAQISVVVCRAGKVKGKSVKTCRMMPKNKVQS